MAKAIISYNGQSKTLEDIAESGALVYGSQSIPYNEVATEISIPDTTNRYFTDNFIIGGKTLTGMKDHLSQYKMEIQIQRDSRWVEGDPVIGSSSSYSDDHSVYGSKTAIFNSSTGTWTLGSMASYSASSLYSSGDKVYISTSEHTLSYQKCTAYNSTPIYSYSKYTVKEIEGKGYYTEGSSSTTSGYSDGMLTIDGYTSYGFSSDSGYYTSGSKKTYHISYNGPDYSGTVYSGGGTSLIRNYGRGERSIVDGHYWETTVYSAEYHHGETRYERGTYIGTVEGPDGAYPSDGIQDGYWYVKGLQIRTDVSSTITNYTVTATQQS